MRTEELASTYQSKSDDELLVLAQSEGLTTEAQLILRNELARRGLKVELKFDSEMPDAAATRTPAAPILRAAHSVSEFTAAVTRVYRDHFGLFLKLTVPAVAISYCVVTFARQESIELARHFLREGTNSRNLILLKAGLITNAGYLIGSLASCASFAAICFAVGRISAGAVPQVPQCIAEVRKRLGLFLRLSLLLIVLVWLAIAVGGLVFLAYYNFVTTKVRLNSVYMRTLYYAILALGFLAVSRFGLAMPAVMLDNYKAGAAMFRSDELTQGKWLTLAVLLIKSVFGGYVAGMMPFWVATWLWKYIQFPAWFLTLASYVGFTLVEPIMFIGFALLYVRMCAKPWAATFEDGHCRLLFNNQ